MLIRTHIPARRILQPMGYMKNLDWSLFYAKFFPDWERMQRRMYYTVDGNFSNIRKYTSSRLSFKKYGVRRSTSSIWSPINRRKAC